VQCATALSRNRPLREERSLAPGAGCRPGALLSPRKATAFALLTLLVCWRVRPPRPLPNPSHGPLGGWSLQRPGSALVSVLDAPLFLADQSAAAAPRSRFFLPKHALIGAWPCLALTRGPPHTAHPPPSHTGTSQEVRLRDRRDLAHRWTSTQLGTENSTSRADTPTEAYTSWRGSPDG
jgi:hypothetical protein